MSLRSLSRLSFHFFSSDAFRATRQRDDLDEKIFPKAAISAACAPPPPLVLEPKKSALNRRGAVLYTIHYHVTGITSIRAHTIQRSDDTCTFGRREELRPLSAASPSIFPSFLPLVPSHPMLALNQSEQTCMPSVSPPPPPCPKQLRERGMAYYILQYIPRPLAHRTQDHGARNSGRNYTTYRNT